MNRLRAAVLVLCLAAAACASEGRIMSAEAPAGASDSIELTDGTLLQGMFMEMSGHDAVIKIPRSQIAKINGAPLPEPVVEGSRAPEFSVKTLSGETMRVGAGQPVTLVKFWATWCPYCRKDVPLVRELTRHYSGSGLRVITIAMDKDEQTVKTFVENEGIDYPVAWQAPGGPDDLSRRYESKGVPNYFLVGADGMIQKIFRGALSVRAVKAEDDIRRVLAATGKPLPERLAPFDDPEGQPAAAP